VSMTDAKPPEAAGPDAAFAAWVADGQLWLQVCDACGAHVFYPRVLCPACGATALDWQPASGRGTVHARAILHRKPKPGDDVPRDHAVVIVELEEGPRLMSRLPGVPSKDIRIGMPVIARIEDATDEDGPVVLFEPAAEDVAPA